MGIGQLFSNPVLRVILHFPAHLLASIIEKDLRDKKNFTPVCESQSKNRYFEISFPKGFVCQQKSDLRNEAVE
jgi:hypothetical protein